MEDLVASDKYLIASSFSLTRFYKVHVFTPPRLGAGVIGIVNIPLEVMEPSHNKQEFLNVQKYNHLLKVMGQYLVQYCKDTGISEYSMAIVRGTLRGLKPGLLSEKIILIQVTRNPKL